MSKEKEIHFLSLVLSGENENQINALIKEISNKQYQLLKKIAKTILKGKYKLTDKEFRNLSNCKKFIRDLAQGKSSIQSLKKNVRQLKEIIAIYFKNNEICGQVCFNSNRRMEKGKDLIDRIARKRRHFYYNTDTDTDTESDQSSKNEQLESESESEKEQDSKEKIISEDY